MKAQSAVYASIAAQQWSRLALRILSEILILWPHHFKSISKITCLQYVLGRLLRKFNFEAFSMANSQFGYVRHSELDDRLLPNTFMVIRLDGKGFTKFSTSHGFMKPNDIRALSLMNKAATHVLESDLGRGHHAALPSKSKKNAKTTSNQPKKSNGIILAYGQSDEFSFAFGRNCQAFNRRGSKILTTVLSTFTAAYVYSWNEFFPESPLEIDNLPTFDGRIIQYATDQELRDYFKWRQVDAHINNLYNTTFWALVKFGSRTSQEAHADLKGTFAKDKHSILFERFQINYNNEPEIFKKGSILIWLSPSLTTSSYEEGSDTPTQLLALTSNTEVAGPTEKLSTSTILARFVKIIHQDLIKDSWWIEGLGSQVLN
ncbi:hypothetical protein O181_062578 [Austropuccinia psidii MF-1]|uniref:tRNA(His) guanylyltransferase n=1 Tax=Austropuccinia psidii MF-1 TaxID=1389203 RepID=A0A9Q3HZN9_9BASI|nr:hypothetical protein [Austropuccinia psidii MF-1]